MPASAKDPEFSTTFTELPTVAPVNVMARSCTPPFPAKGSKSSVVTTLDFDPLAGNGGVQDLAITLTGATVGNSVNVVENSGSFAEAGIVVRAIVTSTGVVTVRATNVTAGVIDPIPLSYRVTVTKF